MFKRFLMNLRALLKIFADKQIPRSAAALSYYLVLALFPMVICLYALLGGSYDKMRHVLELADNLLSPDLTRNIKSFLLYVANSQSTGLLTAGILLLLSSASAAARVMQQGIGEIQGGRRHEGLRGWLLSWLFSLAFLGVLYVGALGMLGGELALEVVDKYLPQLHVSRAWSTLRIPLLGGLVFLTNWGVYELARLKGERGSTAPGALCATLGIVVMSWLFSRFVAVSARYSLVYGSLASQILLMIWLFFCSQLIYLGAAVNTLRGGVKRGGGEAAEQKEPEKPGKTAN